jgi:serine/threonine-protein kinase RsbW
MKFHFSSNLKRVREASARILKQLDGMKCTQSHLFDIRLCFEEAFINAVKYGNQGRPHQEINVELIKHPDRIEIAVWDHGKGFDFDHSVDPTLKENLNKPGGRGVYLIKKLMDRAVYEKNSRCLRMTKLLN